MTSDEQPTDSTSYPGVYTAFELITPSYQLAMQRLDAADGRLQALQAFSGTLTVGATVLGGSLVEGIDFQSAWFVLALASFITLFTIGIVATVHGTVYLISPEKLFAGWLHRDEWTFKKDLLKFAGDDFEKIRAVVKRKGIAATVMATLLLGEILLLVAWVLSER